MHSSSKDLDATEYFLKVPISFKEGRDDLRTTIAQQLSTAVKVVYPGYVQSPTSQSGKGFFQKKRGPFDSMRSSLDVSLPKRTENPIEAAIRAKRAKLEAFAEQVWTWRNLAKQMKYCAKPTPQDVVRGFVRHVLKVAIFRRDPGPSVAQGVAKRMKAIK